MRLCTEDFLILNSAWLCPPPLKREHAICTFFLSIVRFDSLDFASKAAHLASVPRRRRGRTSLYDEQEQCPCEAGLLKRQRRVGALSSLYAEGDFPRCERVCRIRSAVMSQFDLSGRPPIMAIVELDNFGEQYKSVHRVSLSETNSSCPISYIRTRKT
jgi:hypothetical protein